MRYIFLILSLILGVAGSCRSGTQTMDRVEQARQQSDAYWKELLPSKGLSFPPKQLYLRAFKQERQLEVWAGNNGSYQLLKTYAFTAYSGQLGPKQREGDGQIPEGFYTIDRFNPLSNYFLSMRVDYPNAADRIRNKNEKAIGGDIYIHGSNVTIGCIPLGDDHIRELYWLCWQKHQNHPGPIAMHIFPFKMSTANINKNSGAHLVFWKQLTPMFNHFETHKQLREFTVNAAGQYVFD